MKTIQIFILLGISVTAARDLSFGDFCKDISEIASCVTECKLIGGVVQ